MERKKVNSKHLMMTIQLMLLTQYTITKRSEICPALKKVCGPEESHCDGEMWRRQHKFT